MCLPDSHDPTEKGTFHMDATSVGRHWYRLLGNKHFTLSRAFRVFVAEAGYGSGRRISGWECALGLWPVDGV